MKKLILISIVLFPFLLKAQESIDVQRPTLTESNTTIQKNFIQFENGLSYDIASQNFSAATFVRFGATEKLEFRFFKATGDYTFHLSGKVMMYGGKDLLPGIAVTASYEPIYKAQDYRVCLTGSKGKFFYTFNGAYTISYNSNIWIGTNSTGNWYAIALAGISLGNANVFGEYQVNEYIEHQINGGVTYIIKNEVQLDINGGLMMDAVDSYPYVGCGFAFRVK